MMPCYDTPSNSELGNLSSVQSLWRGLMGYGRKERRGQERREEEKEKVEYTQDQYLGTAIQPAAFS